MGSAIKRQLLKELDRRFGALGFTRVSDRFYGDRYDRAISGGRQSIAVACHVRETALVLDPAFASVRLDAVEEEVFRFEKKNELINDHDALQRSTIGIRLDKGELLKTLTGAYKIAEEEDCQRVAEKYTRDVLSSAEQFWQSVHNPEAILAKLSDVPGEAHKYAGTDFFAAIRAIVLTRMLCGDAEARRFADEVLKRLSGESRMELASWKERAFEAWSGVGTG